MNIFVRHLIVVPCLCLLCGSLSAQGDAFDVVNKQIIQTLNDFSQIKPSPDHLTSFHDVISMYNHLLNDRQQKPLLPFVFKQIGAECLRGIILGPCVDYDVMQPIINRELKHSGIQLKIHKSRVPYRNV